MTDGTDPWVGSVDELVARVRPRSRLGVGGVHYTRAPIAALLALCRARIGGHTYVAWGGGLPLEILLAHGLVDAAELCFSNADVFGLAPRYRKAVESGEVQLVERTALQLITGLRSRAEHLEWQPMQVPAGSVFEDPDRRLDTIPPGQTVDALGLDVLILHAQRADHSGNVEIAGARATDLAMIGAAQEVLVTVEERVPRGQLGAGKAIVVPRDMITAIAEAPRGAYPTSCLPNYPADIPAFGRAIASSDADTMRTELTPPVPGPALPRIEPSALSRAVRARRARVSVGEWSVDELMVSWLARTVTDSSICSCGSSSPMAVAAYMLAKRTHAPGALIITMNGCYVDVDERPLTLGLAEYQDFLSAPVHYASEDTYHLYYQPGRVTHEAVGTAQLDAYGATNNLWLDKPSGGLLRLPGQGGMADVANLHRDFLIYLPRHSPMVTTERVRQVSATQAWSDRDVRARYGYPFGRRAVLTDLCVMEPTGEAGRLQIASLHPGVDFEQVRDATGFEIELADGWRYTDVPTERELTVLREEVDPLGVRRLEFIPAKERGSLLEGIFAVEEQILVELREGTVS